MEKDDGVGRPEELINRYVRLVAATANITSGAGTLALLWSTVVLLGGFVSVLEIKEFWIVTAFSFLMAFRVVENFDNEFIRRDIYLEEAKIIAFIRRQKWIPQDSARSQITFLGMVLLLKYIVLVCLVVLSNVTPFVSLGIPVWRLVRRDYGNAGDGDVANTAKLNAALDIFYALALLHSLLISYWTILILNLNKSLLEIALVTSKQCGNEKWSSKLVDMYLSDTRRRFKKDGVLPKRWNLITYGLELLKSASGDDDHRWGARVLDKLLDEDTSSVRQELLSSSLSIQNLMGMIGQRATPENMENRERAIRIVAHLATDLHIRRFPGTLQRICSLLESCCEQQGNSPRAKPDKHTVTDNSYHTVLPITTDQIEDEQAVTSSPSARLTNVQRRTSLQVLMKYREEIKFKREVREYSEPKYRHIYKSMQTKELISHVHLILERLTLDKENCIEISRDQRLLSKITAPLRSPDILSKLCDNMRVQVLSKALRVLSRLLVSLGDGATRLRQELVGNTEVVSNLMGILETDSDGEGAQKLHEQALDILAELAFDDSFKELHFDKLFKVLLHIFLEKEANNTTVQGPNNATAQVEQADATEQATRLRGRAVEALTRLIPIGKARCTLSKQKAINVLSTVVNEILSSKMGTTAATSIGPGEADTDSAQSLAQENEKQYEERKFISAILSLAVVIYNENVISKEDFAYCVTPEDDEALAKKLKEILEVNKNSTAECLRIVKLICQVVLATIKVKPSCIQNFNAHSLKEALAEALGTMSEVDDCMLFAGNDREVIKPVRSLASLVREAQELLQTA